MDAIPLQQIRDKILGITGGLHGGLESTIYLQEIRDAILSVTGGVFGSLNEAIYLQQIRDAVLGVTPASEKYGSLNSAIYLQQIRDAYLNVTSNPQGSLDEGIYLDEILPIATGGDTTAPTCALASTALDLVTGAFTVTATLSEVSTDFDADSLTLVNCTAGVAGSGTSYTLTITPTTDGTASVLVKVGGFHDAAGNANADASNTISRIYLSTLVDWFRSDTGLYTDAGKTTPAANDGDLIYTWDNLGSGNDFVQATETNRPALEIVAGAHFVQTDGVDNFMTCNISADASQTLFVVCQKNTAPDTTTRSFLNFNSANASLYVKSNTNAFFNFWRNQATTNVALGGTPINLTSIGMVFTDATAASFRVNGGAETAFDPDNAYSTATSIIIGANPGPAGPINANYMEIVRCTSPLSDAARTAVEAYLADRIANPT